METEIGKERRLITSALPYINNLPHLGHIVGSHLPADIFARYCRCRNLETLFVGGTDENGSASEIAAAQLGVEMTLFSDTLHKEHKKIYDWFEISYDNFSRTSRKVHHEVTIDFFNKIRENGYVQKGTMDVFYSSKEQQYLPDRYVKGTCAKCGNPDANGDQCEKCTTVLEARQLLNPRSALSNEPIEVRKVEHLFFHLEKLSERLEKWLLEQKRWRPQVRKLAMGWIHEGLKPRCITRDLKNGIRVPLKGFEDKVFYVWFDAPIGYISSTKEARPKDWQRFWKGKNARVYHFLGKDNIPFHTIFWPAMLMANGTYTLPFHVEGFQYLNYGKEKFSKSKKKGVFCDQLPSTGVNPDLMRAYLTFLLPENGDTEFDWEDFKQRVNTDIIGNFGNFVNRTLSLINQQGNRIEKPSNEALTESDKKLIQITQEKCKNITVFFENVRIRSAFLEMLLLSDAGNRYLNENEPWKLLKENPEKARHVLYLCANLCRTLAVLSAPFLPSTSKRIWKQLDLEGSPDSKGNWETTQTLALPAKQAVKPAEILFNKIDVEFLETLKKRSSNTRQLGELFGTKNETA